MSKREIDIHLHRFAKQVQNFDDQVNSLEQLVDGRIKQLRKTISSLELLKEQINQAVDNYKVATERELKVPLRQMEKELEEAREAAAQGTPLVIDNKEGLDKAKTIAIFDSILFAISNWSLDGQTAPDVELACQSVLFPVVYERLMKGSTDYVIPTVPASALEVVRRGREQVKYLRSVSEIGLVSPDTWNEHAPMIQQWWIRDALPLLYGARDDSWENDNPLSLTEVLEWRDQPASRALHFPLIFDGMELVDRFGEEIREFTGLPEFNKNTIETRLEP